VGLEPKVSGLPSPSASKSAMCFHQRKNEYFSNHETCNLGDHALGTSRRDLLSPLLTVGRSIDPRRRVDAEFGCIHCRRP